MNKLYTIIFALIIFTFTILAILFYLSSIGVGLKGLIIGTRPVVLPTP